MTEKKIHRIVLTKDGSFTDRQDSVFYVSPKSIVRLRLSSKKFRERMPVLISNVELHRKSRSRFLNLCEVKQPGKLSKAEFEEKYDYFFGKFNEEGVWQCDVTFDNPGSFFLQIIFISTEEFQKSNTISIFEFGRPEWFVVEPEMSINGKRITSKQLIMQTLLSRCMGPIERWDDLIKQETAVGYNCFHITPLQTLGESGSLYAIRDQLQIASSTVKKNTTNDNGYGDIATIIKGLEQKYNCIFFSEIVLNHTSHDSEWLLDNPNACYNLQNTPQLRSAFELDNALLRFSKMLARREVPEYTKSDVTNEDDLSHLMVIMRQKIIEPLKLHEYFLIDVNKTKEQFIEYMTKHHPQLSIPNKYFEDEEDMFNIFRPDKLHVLIDIVNKAVGNLGAAKHGATIDFKETAKYYVENPNKGSFEQFEMALKEINFRNENRAKKYVEDAVISIHNNLRYNKLERQNYSFSLDRPLLDPYFRVLRDGTTVAHNGWIFNGSQTEEFAESDNFHYLRRNLVIWGDLVKLRYGKSKQDCPALWKRMKKYVKKTASIFQGIRLDNAHGTPIHVAEYFVRKARKANPNIYIFSELFTGSQELDALYSKRIGVNALVREAQRHGSPRDLCGAIYELSQGSDVAVGSLDPYYEYDENEHANVHIMKPRQADALFFDLTHDNPSYHEKRTFLDSVSTASLVSMSNCFIASTKGFDEFYATNPSVVTEHRFYPIHKDPFCGKVLDAQTTEIIFAYYNHPEASVVEVRGSWDDWKEPIKLTKDEQGNFKGSAYLTPHNHTYKFVVDGEWKVDVTKPILKDGHHENNIIKIGNQIQVYSNMLAARQKLNEIHKKVAVRYPEFYLHRLQDDIISINRENIRKTKSYVLVTRSAFSVGGDDVDVTLNLPGRVEKFKLICYPRGDIKKLPTQEDEFLEGIDSDVFIEEDILKFGDILIDHKTQTNYIKFNRMPPGFACVLKVRLNLDQMLAVKELDQLWHDDKELLAKELVYHLTPSQINYLLFSCENEEKEHSKGKNGCYYIPNASPLVYSGFCAFSKMVRDARLYNNLSLPLFDNLRTGNWVLDYLQSRLENHSCYKDLVIWLTKYFGYIKVLPSHLKPKYFTRIIYVIREMVGQKISQTQKLTQNLKLTSFFGKLILSSYSFVGSIESAASDKVDVTMAAGLPHFSTGWTRCWGRDTFISFKGALLIPGMFKEARNIILMFASSLRHGLIPNLLDGCRNPRYNCRDAAWWFVKGVSDYIDFTEDYDILKENIRMRFLSNDKKEHEAKEINGEVKIMTLNDVLFEIFQAHARGIRFREWNAGNQIDSNMQYEGFNIDLALDEVTGFIFGGNPCNQLTWMDKMGSSTKAQNHGVPGSARDGAPIEMTALLKFGLEFVIRLNQNGHFEQKGVKTRNGMDLAFKDWAGRIQTHFEHYYWVPSEPEHFKDYNVNPLAIRRKGIYKDTLRSLKEANDYYLRPNLCIAIAVAPELFNPEKAQKCLATLEKHLIKENSLGIKTLDPREKMYVPFYDNANDSDNYLVAQGFSYHNGPEWVWVYGFFLMALTKFNAKSMNMTVFMSYLTNHKFFIQSNDWESLPEITNDNGEYNHFSCPAQAWSIATLLESIYEARKVLPKHQENGNKVQNAI